MSRGFRQDLELQPLSESEPGGDQGRGQGHGGQGQGEKERGRPSSATMTAGPAMDLFRSEEMQLVQMIIPAESAHSTVTFLGDLGLLQFKDVRLPFMPGLQQQPGSFRCTPHVALT